MLTRSLSAGRRIDITLARNLRLVWPTFREAGVERLVLARYAEDRAQLEEFRVALTGAELFVVRLVAPRP